MKLASILNEIQIGYKPMYTLNRMPSSLTPPDENDTMKSWLDKNNVSIQYEDKSRAGNQSLKTSLRYTINDDFYKDILKVNINDHAYRYYARKNEKNKPLYKQYINEPIKKQWQSYFDRICGKGRVRVSMPEAEGPLRFILPVRSRKFKMIQNEPQ